MKFLFVVAIIATVAFTAHASQCANPPTVGVDIATFFNNRWYELANCVDSRDTIEHDLVCSTANYTVEGADLVKVDNCGVKGNVNGTLKSVVGRARADPSGTPGKFQVAFFGNFWGPYWVTQVYGDKTNGYSVAVIYSCVKELGFEYENYWVLSRTPTLPENLSYDQIYQTSVKQGIDVDGLKVKLTYQGSDCPRC